MKKVLILMTIMVIIAIGLIAEIALPQNPVNEAVLAAETVAVKTVAVKTVEIATPVASPTRGFPDSIPWGTAITLLITILGWIGFGAYWQKFKQLIVELKELLHVINTAIADDKLTAEELRSIIKEAKDILLIFTSNKRELVLTAKRK